MAPTQLFLPPLLTQSGGNRKDVALSRKLVEAMEIVEMVEIRLIRPSPNQVRSNIDDIEDLMISIRANGLLQPIIVRPLGRVFEVVSGHRRLEACRKLHWFLIPSIIKAISEKDAFEISIVENVQRRSLSLLDEAKAYKKYTAEQGWGAVGELAAKVGKSPAYISHTISLLRLPLKIQEGLEANRISRSAAQELLWVRDEALQMQLADRSSTSGITVREIREAVTATGRELGNEKMCFKEADKSPFVSTWIRASHGKDEAILEKAVLSLRIALIRLDALIERTDHREIKDFLIQKRYVVHKLIDEILTERKFKEEQEPAKL